VIDERQFQNKVDFALKLGFSASQIRKAFEKLGANCGQSELLNELVTIGSEPPPVTKSHQLLAPSSSSILPATSSSKPVIGKTLSSPVLGSSASVSSSSSSSRCYQPTPSQP